MSPTWKFLGSAGIVIAWGLAITPHIPFQRTCQIPDPTPGLPAQARPASAGKPVQGRQDNVALVEAHVDETSGASFATRDRNGHQAARDAAVESAIPSAGVAARNPEGADLNEISKSFQGDAPAVPPSTPREVFIQGALPRSWKASVPGRLRTPGTTHLLPSATG